MTDTEAFVEFVVQYASDRFDRDSINAFLAVPESSAILRRWKSLFDGGQQQQILSELGQSQAQKDWKDWGALDASEHSYQSELDLFNADLDAYKKELDALTDKSNPNNTPLAIETIKENIARTEKAIADTKDKMAEIARWKLDHPDKVEN